MISDYSDSGRNKITVNKSPVVRVFELKIYILSYMNVFTLLHTTVAQLHVKVAFRDLHLKVQLQLHAIAC